MYYFKNLEIHVVDHCNLDCVGCSHESPFVACRYEDPDRLGRALSVLWKWYQTPLVKLLGGEPLLHPRIDDIITVIKTRVQARIRIVTNGTLLKDRYHHLHGVDEIHISSYPGVPIPSDNDLISITKELSAPITIQFFGHFRWHRSLPRNDPKLTERIFATCQLYHSWHCHTLCDGWFYPCPPAGTWATGNGEGVNLLAPGSDHKVKIERLLVRQRPFTSCDQCLGSVGQRFEHRLGWHRSPIIMPGLALDAGYLQHLELDYDAHNGCFEYERTILPSGDVQLHRDSL